MRTRWRWVAAVAVIVIAVFGYWVWSGDAARRAVERMPAEERKATYLRTLEDLRTTCAPGYDEGLRQHCREQAHFILAFPECDSACEALAAAQDDHPTK